MRRGRPIPRRRPPGFGRGAGAREEGMAVAGARGGGEGEELLLASSVPWRPGTKGAAACAWGSCLGGSTLRGSTSRRRSRISRRAGYTTASAC